MSIIAKRKRGRPRKYHLDIANEEKIYSSELQLERTKFFKELEQFKKTFPYDKPFYIADKDIDLFLLDKYVKEYSDQEDIWNILPEKFSISSEHIEAPILFKKLYEQQRLKEFSSYRSQSKIISNPKNPQPQLNSKTSRFSSRPVVYPQSTNSLVSEDGTSRLDILKSISLDHFQGTNCRIFKALESGFPNEIDWALYQSVKLSSVIDVCSLYPQSPLPRQVLQIWKLAIKNDFLNRLFIHSNPFFQSIHTLFSHLQSNMLPKDIEPYLFISCSNVVHSFLADITKDTDIYGIVVTDDNTRILCQIISLRMLQIVTIIHHCTLLPEEDVKWITRDHCNNLIRQYLVKFSPLIKVYSLISTSSDDAMHWEPFYNVMNSLFSTSWIECVRLLTESIANISSILDISTIGSKFIDPFVQIALHSNEIGMITASLDILSRLSFVNGDIMINYYKTRFGISVHSRWIELLISPIKKIRLAISEFIFQYMNILYLSIDGMTEFIQRITPILFHVLLDELQCQGKVSWLRQLKETNCDEHNKLGGLGAVHIAIRWIMMVSGYQVGNMKYHEERVLVDDLYKEYVQFCKRAVDAIKVNGGSMILSQRELVQVFAQVFPGCIPSRQYWTIPQPVAVNDTIYSCKWDDCSERKDNLNELIQHIIDHSIKEKSNTTFCKWNGCTKCDIIELLPHIMTHVISIAHTDIHAGHAQITEQFNNGKSGVYALPSFLYLKRKAISDHHGINLGTRMNDICNCILYILAKISNIPLSEHPFISQETIKDLFHPHMNQLVTYWSLSSPHLSKPIHIIFDNLASMNK